MNNNNTTTTTDTNVYVCPNCGCTESVSKGYYADGGKIRRCKNPECTKKQFRGTWGDGSLANGTQATNTTQTQRDNVEDIRESTTPTSPSSGEWIISMNGNETKFDEEKKFLAILEACGGTVEVDPENSHKYIIKPPTGSKN